MDFLETELYALIKQKSKINAKFIETSLKQLKKHNIEFNVYKEKTPDGFTGCFDDYKKEMSASYYENKKGKIEVEEFVGLFAHEFCHFIQWKNNLKIFKDYDNIRGFLENKDEFYNDVSKDIKIMTRLESDCEKRVVKLINQGKLELNLKRYIRTANCYLAFYGVFNITQNWWKETPFKFKEILELVPTDRLIKNIDCLQDKKQEFIIRSIKNCY